MVRGAGGGRLIADAGATVCAHCGHRTVTVDGVCPDCWSYKADDGVPERPRPEEPRSYPGSLSPPLWLVGLILALALRLAARLALGI